MPASILKLCGTEIAAGITEVRAEPESRAELRRTHHSNSRGTRHVCMGSVVSDRRIGRRHLGIRWRGRDLRGNRQDHFLCRNRFVLDLGSRWIDARTFDPKALTMETETC